MDYNIYIHEGNTVENEEPTKAWKSAESDGQSSSDPFTKGVKKTVGYLQNPDAIVTGAVSSFMRAVPYVAAAYAVVKLTDSIITTANSFITTETGDYRFATKYNNFKAGLNACFRPFSTTINYFKFEQQIRIENERKALQRELFGDTSLTGSAFYGV